jgi:hypothetical protein
MTSGNRPAYAQLITLLDFRAKANLQVLETTLAAPSVVRSGESDFIEMLAGSFSNAESEVRPVQQYSTAST